jgi:hypothetical protein
MSFAQHMWRVFRQNSLSVHHVEQLFSLRSNLVELFKIQTVSAAPILFAMALFIWLLPLVAIYPPSALTVSLRAHSDTQDLDVSVLNPLRSDLDPFNPERNVDSTLSVMSRAISPYGNKDFGGAVFSLHYSYVVSIKILDQNIKTYIVNRNEHY